LRSGASLYSRIFPCKLSSMEKSMCHIEDLLPFTCSFGASLPRWTTTGQRSHAGVF
jgi:hypothetical protein